MLSFDRQHRSGRLLSYAI